MWARVPWPLLMEVRVLGLVLGLCIYEFDLYIGALFELLPTEHFYCLN